MMATSTRDTFVERLTRSQLLDAKQLEPCLASAGEDEQALIAHLLKENLLTHFQVRQLRAGATNFHVGKYIITDCIGRGGNGIVFKARHRLMPRYVALKTLDSTSLHQANESVNRFKREIDIVARLEHPNVVRAIDVLQTRKHLYLVLEYVVGKDLGAVVKERGPLPVPEVIHYALQIARGLQYAHNQGIIHRDLKPENLLVTADGVIKLSDLGLARLHEGDHVGSLTTEGLCLGTPEYMAPEQAEDARSADRRSDLYSMGATLFHLLTGQLPVSGNSYMHRLQHLLTAPPRPLAQVRPDAPPELAAIVDRLRERNPAARPQSAEELILLLEPLAVQTQLDDPNNWPAERKTALVLQALADTAKAEDLCRRHRIKPVDFDRWRQAFVEAGTKALG
jgi:serine/threonine-protein kinase